MWNLIPTGITSSKEDSALRGCCQSPSGTVCNDQKILCLFPPPHQLSLLTGGHLISHQRWTKSTMAHIYWGSKQSFFFRIILGVSSYLKAEGEARVRIAAPRTATLLRWIYNSHFNWCQEDTELPMSHFSTAVNRLGWTSGMHIFFWDLTTTAKPWTPPVLPTGSGYASLSWMDLLETYCMLYRRGYEMLSRRTVCLGFLSLCTFTPQFSSGVRKSLDVDKE